MPAASGRLWPGQVGMQCHEVRAGKVAGVVLFAPEFGFEEIRTAIDQDHAINTVRQIVNADQGVLGHGAGTLPVQG